MLNFYKKRRRHTHCI